MSSIKSLSDENLMQAYQAGDAHAFDELYRRHSGRVYAYLRKRLPSAEETDEVFQAVFLKAHRSRNQYRLEYPVLQWLYVISQTSLVDHTRKAGRTSQLQHEQAILQEITLSQTAPDPALSSTEGADEALVKDLPEDQRRVIEMRVFEEKDYEEIAALLGKSQVSVRQIYSRAIRRLRTLITSPQGVRKS